MSTTAVPARTPRVLTDLGPIAQLRAGRLGRRLPQLYAGLVLYGFSMALMVRAELGVMPWDVLHQGIARSVGASLGTVSVAVGALVLLLWIPLRQRPGVGTLSNVVMIGLSVDASIGLAAGTFSAKVLHRPRFRRRLERASAVVFGGLAGRLVVEGERR